MTPTSSSPVQTARSLVTLRPWGSDAPEALHWMLKIPWSVFTYRFNFETGLAMPCAERFRKILDGEGEVTGYRRLAGTVNLDNCPKLSFDQVVALYDQAEEEDLDLVDAFAESFGLDMLNAHEQRKLALAPRYKVVKRLQETLRPTAEAERAKTAVEALRARAAARPAGTAAPKRKVRRASAPETAAAE